MQYMEIKEDGSLAHHIIMTDQSGPLHLVAQGEAHYGNWLKTEEERVASKEYGDELDNLDEWNKFASRNFSRGRKSYDKGAEAWKM